MPTKVLAKLHVAHKAFIRIKRHVKEKNERMKAAKKLLEKMKAAAAMSEKSKLGEAEQVKDQPPKKFYLHPRVQKLWADKEREPEDDNWFMENISRRNFSLFSEFYPSFKKSKLIPKKRKVIDCNEEVSINLN